MSAISSDYSVMSPVLTSQSFEASKGDEVATEKSVEEIWVMNNLSWDSVVGFVNTAEKTALQSLSDGVTAMLDSKDLKSVAGFTDEKVNSFLKTLDEAIENQDYKTARKTVEQFFSAGSEKISDELAMVMETADGAFWHSLDEQFNYKMKLKGEAQNIISGVEFERTLGDVLGFVRKSVEKENPPISETDEFEATVDTLFDQAVDHTRGKLKNAGRNKYSENGESVLGAAISFMRDHITGDDLMDQYNPSAPFAMSFNTKAYHERVLDEQKELNEMESISQFTDRYDKMGEDFLNTLKETLGNEEIVVMEKVKANEVSAESSDGPEFELETMLPDLEQMSAPVSVDMMIQSMALPEISSEKDLFGPDSK
ncbi:hypothetical protein SYK_03220 [Pseudodesulfovibrio nedwellii]|uniref:DUF5610 domain-containing protein n=1 Tax=Pseudodesulfovibrio nedwellii TaxID=2973072 RepID=A0ABM8AWT6_9BACT|nr:hypothetical protein [Pseudodesulfovibrio nedwellii]BDQ35962.1 hypothetical protein SYK_03220 [Pseudodesulfovibrio nedwellii]